MNLPVTVGTKRFTILVDTSAALSVISKTLYEELKQSNSELSLVEEDKKVESFNGYVSQVIGVFQIPV